MINASLYMMLALLAIKYIHNIPRRITIIILCMALTFTIGYSRIYLGVHYAGDVIGGWIFGFVISLFICFIWNSDMFKKNNKKQTNR